MEFYKHIQDVIGRYPAESYSAIVFVTLIISPFLQKLVGRVALHWAIRSETVIDDLIVDALRPFRFVYALPVGLALAFAEWAKPFNYEAQLISGLLFIILAVEAAIKIFGAMAAVVRHKSGDRGASSTGFFDILKILSVLVGLAFAAAITIDTDIITLLGGLGAATAVLSFIFKDTLHAIFASMKIASWGLIREGDWIEVPSYNADGIVVHIGLYDIAVRNWDLSVSLVPTHQVLEVANKNYRPMQKEARARRIQEKFYLDSSSVKVVDRQLLEGLRGIECISDVVEERLALLPSDDGSPIDPFTAAKLMTNLEMFRLYIDHYLRTRKDIHQKQNFILIRILAPTRHGIPIDIFAYTRKTDLIGFSEIQTAVFNNFLAMSSFFELQLFQSSDDE